MTLLEEPAPSVPPPPATPEGPPLPLGRRVILRGRGTTFFREVPGPPGAPTVLLLHGWMASGGLNWYRTFDGLGQHFRVVAQDMRGHGRGIRSRRRFRLSDCADDAAALLEKLDAAPAIVCGYSLGGPVAQLLWRRHPDLVQGLVLCSTAHHLMPGRREQWIFGSMMGVAAGTTRAGMLAAKIPSRQLRRALPVPIGSERPTSMRRWARAEMGRHSARMILEAGVAMSNYSAVKWIGDVDVPTTVVVTAKDRAISPIAQLRLALAIPGATIHRVDDGHLVCAKPTFAEPVLQACLEVARRSS